MAFPFLFFVSFLSIFILSETSVLRQSSNVQLHKNIPYKDISYLFLQDNPIIKATAYISSYLVYYFHAENSNNSLNFLLLI